MAWSLFDTINSVIAGVADRSIVDVPLEGVFKWELIFNYDNSMNSGTIKHTVREKTVKVYKSKIIWEKVNEYTREQRNTNGTRVNIGGKIFKPIKGSLDYNCDYSNNIKDFVSSHMTEEKDCNEEVEHEVIREYTVGPNSKLELYQLFFYAPGIKYACSALSTVKKEDQPVHLIVRAKPIEFISNLKIELGFQQSDAPQDRLRTSGYGVDGDNINYGISGYYWLVPEYTTRVEDAATSFEVTTPDYGDSPIGPRGLLNIYYLSNPSSYFLPSGWFPHLDLLRAIADFREVKPVKNQRDDWKITEIKLVRSTRALSLNAFAGYNGMSENINENRARDYLYLVYKRVQVFL